MNDTQSNHIATLCDVISAAYVEKCHTLPLSPLLAYVKSEFDVDITDTLPPIMLSALQVPAPAESDSLTCFCDIDVQEAIMIANGEDTSNM